MPSWDYDGKELPIVPAFDPDTIEVPDPYTPEEWAETEGAPRRRVSTAASPLPFESVDPGPFIDGWHNR